MKFKKLSKNLKKYQNKHVVCVCCGWEGSEFLPCPFGLTPRRKNSLCPNCGSLERHRLYFLFLRDVLSKRKKIKLLHFAPELSLKNLFMSYSNIEYISVDLYDENAMFKEDITKLSFKDNSFDVIFCSHVFEHIEDDRKAMTEIYRVLKNGGFAILQVPIHHYTYNGKKLERTFEDFRITDPKKRKLLFGQEDHVRLYSLDYKDRLIEAGFYVSIKKFAASLKSSIVKLHVLIPDGDKDEENGWIYFCTKKDGIFSV